MVDTVPRSKVGVLFTDVDIRRSSYHFWPSWQCCMNHAMIYATRCAVVSCCGSPGQGWRCTQLVPVTENFHWNSLIKLSRLRLMMILVIAKPLIRLLLTSLTFFSCNYMSINERAKCAACLIWPDVSSAECNKHGTKDFLL